jgi:hypothetical protein
MDGAPVRTKLGTSPRGREVKNRRQSLSEGCHAASLKRDAMASQEKYVGALQDIAITWTVDRHTTVQLLAA